MKISNQSIQAAVVNQVPAGKVVAVSRVLNTNRDQMRVAQSIYDQFKSGEMKVPYVAETTKCNEYPADYAKCVADMWIARTRASEKKSDEVRDPKNKKDTTLYRKRFLDSTILELCGWMNKRGKELTDDLNFSVSIKKMCDLMPHFIKKQGRQTSLCRYHMENENDCDAGRRWSVAATKSAGCDCKWPTNAREMRQAMMCAPAKGNGSDWEYYPRECVLSLHKTINATNQLP